MKALKLSLAAGVALALLNVAVHAETFKIGDPGGWFELGQGWIEQGGGVGSLSVWWSVEADFAKTLPFELNAVGDVFTVPFSTAELNSEVAIDPTETDFLDIVAHVQLVLPKTLDLLSMGVVGVFIGPTCDSPCTNGQDTTVDDITVTFPDTQVAFGVGGLLGLSLSPIAFTHTLSSLPIEATFTLLEAPPLSGSLHSPEPGTWALLGTGLIGLLSYGWRRHAAQARRPPAHASSCS